jgi:hypothetical protein
MTVDTGHQRGEHLTFHELMYNISHPHLPEHEPGPVSAHHEPAYLETARMSRAMGHL